MGLAARVPLLVATILAAGAGLVVHLARGGTPEGERAVCRGALIPAYVDPAGLARLAHGPEGRRMTIVNPANGPGAAPQPGYREAIAAERSAGVQVLGYVHTGYGARDPAAVLADARRYRAWYGTDGVFLDEAGHSDEQLPYYQAISQTLRGLGERIVLNPGVVPTRGYFGIADVVVTFEGPASEYAAAVGRMPAWVGALPRSRVAHLIHTADADQAMRAAALGAAGWLYATSGALPDPWSTLPPYLETLEARLSACA
jgi:Spherulation-specific family 4